MSELKYSKEQIIDACKEAGLGILECNSLITVLGCCQPEATKPAQDLGAAILALPLPQPVGHVEYSVPGEPMTRICAGYSPEQIRQLLKAAAALASPADALVEGDREKYLRERNKALEAIVRSAANDLVRINAALGLPDGDPVDADEILEKIAAIQAQKDEHG